MLDFSNTMNNHHFALNDVELPDGAYFSEFRSSYF